MADLEAHYRIYLRQELERRKSKNARYSLRAFAKSLKIDNGQLSKIIAGKALLSVDLADQLAKKLKLTGDERKEFLVSAAEEQKCLLLYLVDPSLTDCDSKEASDKSRCASRS
jgi:transcriptional regulator with XRE-family HTH domain